MNRLAKELEEKLQSASPTSRAAVGKLGQELTKFLQPLADLAEGKVLNALRATGADAAKLRSEALELAQLSLQSMPQVFEDMMAAIVPEPQLRQHGKRRSGVGPVELGLSWCMMKEPADPPQGKATTQRVAKWRPTLCIKKGCGTRHNSTACRNGYAKLLSPMMQRMAWEHVLALFDVLGFEPAALEEGVPCPRGCIICVDWLEDQPFFKALLAAEAVGQRHGKARMIQSVVPSSSAPSAPPAVVAGAPSCCPLDAIAITAEHDVPVRHFISFESIY